jgi:hypothetical protein
MSKYGGGSKVFICVYVCVYVEGGGVYILLKNKKVYSMPVL